MILNKTDELIQVEELFANFNAEVDTLESSHSEIIRQALALKVQYEEIQADAARNAGRVAQAREDRSKLTAIITQANLAWDKELVRAKETRLNDVEKARLEWFKKGYKEAYAEIKGTPKKRKPRPVSETVLVSRAKKALAEELKSQSKETAE